MLIIENGENIKSMKRTIKITYNPGINIFFFFLAV